MAATPTNAWSAPSPHLQPAQQVQVGMEELAMQTRPMGLKVHYTFDRDNNVHCMARCPHVLQIQTIPLDERTAIGVIDLRTCLLAVSSSSPEILTNQENDYSVYAYDYSESDVPLVGQGMLSWAMDSQREPQQQQQQQQQQQLVTGRVTRNLFALMNNGCRDMLEVKLKFTAVPRMVPRTDYAGMTPVSEPKSTPLPADTASEWNSFIQANPMLGHSSNVGAVSSPALAPVQLHQYHNSMSEKGPMEMRSDNQLQQPMRPASIPPPNAFRVSVPPVSRAPSVAPAPPRPQGAAENAPSPAASQPTEPIPQPRPSRPASRSRSKQPTGRPRGRPRKKPVDTGNTSAAEEATDGDDGPQKKRAKVTRTEYSAIAPFGAVSDSLRVAASTSGSLRNMRPVGAAGEGPAAANHLQDVPRAPTPIPDGSLLHQQQRRRVLDNQTRSEYMMSMDQSNSSRQSMQSMSQDARSPADSIAQSPDHGYSPEDSAGDLGSSPPVPRPTAYMQSSPPASSPILPTMPMPPLDSGFMSGGLEDFFDDEDVLQHLPQGQMQDQVLPVPSLPVASKPNSRKNSRAQQQQHPNFPFQEVTPGPPELLPTKSIFNPAGKAKALNRHTPAPAQAASKKPTNRSLKRSNTAPNPVKPEQALLQAPLPQEHPGYHHQNGHGFSQPPEQQYPFPEQNSFSDSMNHLAQSLEHPAGNGYADVGQQEQASAAAIPVPISEHPEPEPEPALPAPPQPASMPASRPVSRGPSAPPVPVSNFPASEPAPESFLTMPQMPMSEALCPASDFDPPRYSKNLVKKQTIKERLETAIQKGESPPFCNNCGAIETPTWRKIWTQEHDGVPGFHEFSDKPGCVTMIEVLERDPAGQPSKYRMVKKNLGAKDDKKLWAETLLCNPCGIWLGKFKVHRPPDRWDKDAARLNQPRRKRDAKNSRSKKGRSKSDAQVNPTSEAYFTTDPIGPMDLDENYENGTQSGHLSMAEDNKPLNLQSSPKQRLLGSTHSRGSGTADSPIAVEDDLGSTRRLLFPSPRKDGMPKVLGELSLNTVQNTKTRIERPGTPVPDDHDDLEQELFGTPPRAGKRHSPRNHHTTTTTTMVHYPTSSHFALDDQMQAALAMNFDSPFTATLHQLLVKLMTSRLGRPRTGWTIWI
ncbi:hypothetical protein N0V88_001313 [Collariella sp. IMI 366227]|nr:hypothetical protein N0V88_001313 [Collariella sp. IMI 366227]